MPGVLLRGVGVVGGVNDVVRFHFLCVLTYIHPIQAPPAPSTLTVDAWDEGRLQPQQPSSETTDNSSSALQWSSTTMEALYAGHIRGQAFPIFDLSICGTPVFGA